MCKCNDMKSQSQCNCCCKDSKKECSPKNTQEKQGGQMSRNEGESTESRNRNKMSNN